MRLMSKMLMVVALMVAMLVIGCGQAVKEPAKAAAPSVADKIKAAGFEMVKIDEVKAIVGNGVYSKERGTLIDARPARVSDKGYIPTSFNLPDTKFDEYFPAFEKLGLAKDDLIVTYCGGVKCGKSLIVAKELRAKGYTNIRIYLDGEPDWTKQGKHIEIAMSVAKKNFDKGGFVFIDARPERVFKKGTIAGSINIPDTKFDEYKDQLPADKNAAVIAFCGGFKCEKSHVVAERMLAMGYTNVSVYAGGVPEWKAAGYPMAKGGEAAAVKKEMKPMASDGFKIEEQGILITQFFIDKLLDPADRPADVTIVDVRNADEVAAGKIPGSVNVSSKVFQDEGCDAFLSKMPKEGRVVFHCASGGRAGEVYFGLLDDCKPADIDRYYFLDAGVNCDTQPCKIGM